MTIQRLEDVERELQQARKRWRIACMQLRFDPDEIADRLSKAREQAGFQLGYRA